MHTGADGCLVRGKNEKVHQDVFSPEQCLLKAAAWTPVCTMVNTVKEGDLHEIA